jgi:hypothetical protein
MCGTDVVKRFTMHAEGRFVRPSRLLQLHGISSGSRENRFAKEIEPIVFRSSPLSPHRFLRGDVCGSVAVLDCEECRE